MHSSRARNYKERLQKGLCVLCPNLLDREGSICSTCLNKRKTRRKERIDQGLCRCGRSREGTLSNCDICLAVRRQSGKEYRKLWEADGLCTVCGKVEAMEDHKLCSLCIEKDLIYRQRMKATAITGYGAKCICCGETNIDFLTIDHINGRHNDSGKDTKKGVRLYCYVIKNGFPADFQVLCFNCNCGKKNRVDCPHKIDSQNNWDKYRDRILEKYGSYCYCCGETNTKFLTFEHINNDGAEHRRLLKSLNTTIYAWIKQNNYPDSITIACFNCNCVKSITSDGKCPH